MRFRLLLGSAMGVAAAAALAQTAPAPATTLDRVYTEAQAARGKQAYLDECSSCHSEDLGGSGYATALKGDEFMTAWGNRTVGDLFDKLRKVMPPDNPGTLSAEMYRDIIAFVLQENKYPAGDRELAADSATLRTIKITPPAK